MARPSSFLNLIKTLLKSRVSRIVTVILVAAAFALLIVVDVTAPVNHGLALFTARNRYVEYNEGSPVIHLGTFGYCMQIVADFSSSSVTTGIRTPDSCSPPSIGYDPLDALSPVSSALDTSVTTSAEQHLTSAMVLHPLATGFSFITLISALLPSRLAPKIVAPLLAGLTALLTLAALICDLVLFSRLKQRLDDAGDLAVLSYDVGLWAVVAAFACLVVATALLGARWWFQRRMRSSVPGAGREGMIETKQDEGKTDRSPGSAAAAAPYELGGKTRTAELSQGAVADRHELSEQRRYVELSGEGRHELDTPV